MLLSAATAALLGFQTGSGFVPAAEGRTSGVAMSGVTRNANMGKLQVRGRNEDVCCHTGDSTDTHAQRVSLN